MVSERANGTVFSMRQNAMRIQHVTGVVTVFMALVVMGGWFTRNASVVQIYHEFAPMQFNTALGFLWAGISLCVIRKPLRRLHGLMGVALVALGLASVSQYFFHIDLGIDELIVEPFTTVRTSHPGRMAPNTAICFTLSGFALICVGLRRFEGAACIGAMIMALGLVSIFGYVSGVDSAYGWGDLTRMALHTSVGFVLVGLGLVLELVADEPFGRANFRVLSVVVALLSLTCSLAIWQALLAERGRIVVTDLHRDAARAASEVQLVMGQTLGALERFAYRAAETAGDPVQSAYRAEDSTRYLEDFTGLTRLSWIDMQGGARWTHDREQGGENVPPLPEENGLAQKLRLQGVGGPFVGEYYATDGGATMVFGTAVSSRGGEGEGILIAVFDAEEYFAPVLAHTSDAQRLRLRIQDADLYVRDARPDSVLAPRFVAMSTMSLPGGTLQIELVATEAFVSAGSSRIIYVVLIGGFLVSGLLILSTHLAVRSWHAQEALQHQYSRHRLVVNHVPAMIAAFDAENHLTFANAPFVALVRASSEQAILGATPRELLGTYYHEVSHHLQRALAGDTVRYEVRVEAGAGLVRFLETQLVPHRHAGGAVDSYYALILDVTEQREWASRLEETADRLRRFSGLAIGREERMMVLKEEVNQLLRELNRADRYTPAPLDQVLSDAGEGGEA